MRTTSLLLACSLLALAGCGMSPPGASPPRPRKVAAPPHDQVFAGRMLPAGAAQDKQAPVAAKAQVPAEQVERKILRKAEVRLVVPDFDKAAQELRNLIGRFRGAYVAQAETDGSAGSPRYGHWKIRVPVSDFDSFLDAVAQLGVPERQSVDAQDVTEEYYDLETRIKNKKVEEQRLLKHLEQSTGKLDEILKVEREISRVRGEIEQGEGRLRLLANLTSLTTVDVAIREQKNYVPPRTPTFATAIAETFFGSVDLLIGFGKAVVLAAAGLAPWLPLLAAGVLLAWALLRRGSRRAPAPGSPA